MDIGDAKTAGKDHQAALEAYRGADDIMRVPTTGIEVARSLERLGKLVEALEAYVRVTRMPASAGEPRPFTVARTDAERAAADLEARTPTLIVELRGLPSGGRAELTLDGQTLEADRVGLPMRVNPGDHRVSGKAPGFSRAEGAVKMLEGDAKTIILSFQAQPGRAAGATGTADVDAGSERSESDGSSLRWMWVGFGIGAAGIGAGSVTGILSLTRAAEAKKVCVGTRCPESARSDIEASKRLATMSNIAFGVGLLGVGIGAWKLVAAGSASRADASAQALRIQPYVGAGEAGVFGRF
jgi:hypothetical protein